MITEVQAGRYRVRGMSLGGMYTALQVPELDALFDAGAALRTGCSAGSLFVSHTHIDHIGSLPALLGMRGLSGVEKPLRVFLPAGLEVELEAALSALSQIHRWPLRVEYVPMRPGDQIMLRRDLWVRAFRTWHPVPSLGYLFVRPVEKLRAEHHGLPGAEIQRRKRAGEDLFERHEHLELAYATDTLPRVLETEPSLLRVRTLILECTFLDERKSLEAARAGSHIHLDELLPWAERLENEALVLMHFSQLYTPREVHAILRERWPKSARTQPVALAPDGDEWWL